MANGWREQFGADYALAVGPFPSMETTAEQAGKGIQETFSTVVTKMKDVYAA